MAQESFYATSSYAAGMLLQLILSSSGNGAAANSSTVNYTLNWCKPTINGSYAYSHGNHLYLTLNGNSIISTADYGRIDISGLPAGGVVQLASGNITVAHNADGTKTIPVYARFYQSQRSDCDYIISTTFTLDKINRYAAVSLTVGGITKNSISVTANTSLPCKVFNFQYSPDNGTHWYAENDSGAISGAAKIYNIQSTKSYTHTYSNLHYASAYKFRCLVTTDANQYTGSGSVTPVGASTAVPALAALASSSVVPNNNMTFGISIPDSGTTYSMSVRTDNMDAPAAYQILEDGSNRHSETSRTASASLWATCFYPYYPSSTSGKISVRVVTYSKDENKYMGENRYSLNVDFSSVNLNPVIGSGFATFTRSLPDGILSNFVDGYTITSQDAKVRASWNASHITLKGGASIRGYRISWNQTTENLLSASATSYTSYSTIVGQNPFKIEVIDSRGHSANTTLATLTSVKYESPVISLVINRNGYSKNIIIDGKCNVSPLYINSTFYNTYTLSIQYKRLSDTSYTSITVSPSSMDTDGYFTVSQMVSDIFSLTDSYEILVTLSDKVGTTITRTYSIPAATPLLSMCEDGAVGVNCYPAEENMFAVNGNSHFSGNVFVENQITAKSSLGIEGTLSVGQGSTFNGVGTFKSNISVAGTSSFTGSSTFSGSLSARSGIKIKSASSSSEITSLYSSSSSLMIGNNSWNNIYYDVAAANYHIFRSGGASRIEIRPDCIFSNQGIISHLGSQVAQFRAVYGNYGFIIRNDGGNTHFLVTNSGDAYGGFNGLRPLSINNSTGKCAINASTVEISSGRGLHMTAAPSDANFPHIYGTSNMLALGPWNSNVYDIVIGISGSDGNDSYGLRPSIKNGVAGHVHLGTPTYRWRNIYSATSVNVSSDRREKKDIVYTPYEKSIAFIRSLAPASYKYIDGDSGRTHKGLIAQDVENSLSELGLTSMDFAGLIKSPVYETIKDENGVEQPTDIVKDYTYALRYEEFESDIINVLKYLLDENTAIKKAIETRKER
ncbi:DUF859 family phage minor structural protein [Qiania dongpingensis]|uniref:Tail fiber domain-containing protein n=1 Tax=Qiania dongpingensis TaxID=2763669 RepID=A0A7G9G5K3_9FIRM|nr:DUF859 family phage minor structural protein [Qiania dongpingensis]QNM06085.1 tail fiber domain-containing protein [Qiania dongpingensis]